MKRLAMLCFVAAMLAGASSYAFQSPQWVAKIAGVERHDRNALITVVYSNGNDSFAQEYNFDGSNDPNAWIKQQVDSQIERLNRVDQATKGVSLATISSVPEPIDADREEFQAALDRMRRIQRAKDLGVIAVTDKDYTDALNALKATYRAEYLDLF